MRIISFYNIWSFWEFLMYSWKEYILLLLRAVICIDLLGLVDLLYCLSFDPLDFFCLVDICICLFVLIPLQNCFLKSVFPQQLLQCKLISYIHQEILPASYHHMFKRYFHIWRHFQKLHPLSWIQILVNLTRMIYKVKETEYNK